MLYAPKKAEGGGRPQGLRLHGAKPRPERKPRSARFQEPEPSTKRYGQRCRGKAERERRSRPPIPKFRAATPYQGEACNTAYGPGNSGFPLLLSSSHCAFFLCVSSCIPMLSLMMKYDFQNLHLQPRLGLLSSGLLFPLSAASLSLDGPSNHKLHICDSTHFCSPQAYSSGSLVRNCKIISDSLHSPSLPPRLRTRNWPACPSAVLRVPLDYLSDRSLSFPGLVP